MLTAVSLAPAADSLSLLVSRALVEHLLWAGCHAARGESGTGCGFSLQVVPRSRGARCQWRALNFEAPPSWGGELPRGLLPIELRGAKFIP